MPTNKKKRDTSERNETKRPAARKTKNPFSPGMEAKFKTFKEFGAHIVADPKICHGRVTFRGTRIFVNQVLELVAMGMDWDQIQYECHGFVSKEAIAEAVSLAALKADEWSGPAGRVRVR
jgi:uncharacterized protein (DUF433 family)